MLAHAFGTGVPFAWVTADEVYGQATYLRACRRSGMPPVCCRR